MIERGARQGHGAGGFLNFGEKFPRPQGFSARIEGSYSYTGFQRTPPTSAQTRTQARTEITGGGQHLSLPHATTGDRGNDDNAHEGLEEGKSWVISTFIVGVHGGEMWPARAKKGEDPRMARVSLTWRGG